MAGWQVGLVDCGVETGGLYLLLTKAWSARIEIEIEIERRKGLTHVAVSKIPGPHKIPNGLVVRGC